MTSLLSRLFLTNDSTESSHQHYLCSTTQGFAGGRDAAFVKRREKRAGADRIDPDAVPGVVHGQAPRQARHRGFGGVILVFAAHGLC